MRGKQAIFNLEIKKKSGLSINPDIHHSKVLSSGWKCRDFKIWVCEKYTVSFMILKEEYQEISLSLNWKCTKDCILRFKLRNLLI